MTVQPAAIVENPAGAPAPAGPYSQVARIDLGPVTMLIMAGQIAVAEDGELVGPDDIGAQSERIFDIIEALLAAYGATLADVVNIRTFMTDLGQLRAYGAVRNSRLGGHRPTSTTVQVPALFRPGALLEVEVTAVISR